MSFIDISQLDSIEVPELDFCNTNIKFKLCHVNKVLKSTCGVSQWLDKQRQSPDRLPSFSTETNYNSNLFPKFDTQKRIGGPNYEDHQYTTNYRIRHRRIKTQGVDDRQVSSSKKFSINSDNFRVKRSFTRASENRQHRSSLSESCQKQSPKRLQASLEVTVPDIFKNLKEKNKVKRVTKYYVGRQGLRLQKQKNYQMGKLCRRNVIPDYLIFSSRKNEKDGTRLLKKVIKSAFSQYRQDSPELFQ